MFKKIRESQARCTALESEVAALTAQTTELITQRDAARQQAAETESQAALAGAIDKAVARIEFGLDGTILSANAAFLNAVGYQKHEVIGQRHRIFVSAQHMTDEQYAEFWQRLRQGEHHNGQYCRLRKDGSEIWIQATYTPVLDADRRVARVVKIATDITAQKQHQAMTDRLLREARDVMVGLADGDLTHRVEGEYIGAFAELSESINRTVDKFGEITADIRNVAKSVDGGANAISSGNMNLSQRTEQQSASLAQTSANMQTMTHTVSENADNARTANHLAILAQDKAEEGGGVVEEAIQAMNDINESSKKIGDIIGVIDEIAFQTNLLALNAAVEAARAGEHGRGFSVVASEVRSLAGRSATAAKEIKALIHDSGMKVKQGTRLVNQSGSTLDEIVNGVKEVTDIVGQIATASEDQSTGIREVNDAVRHMDQLTQQNTALVEEAAASSETLSEQARHLGQLTDFFTTGEEPLMDANDSAPEVASKPVVERRSADRPWSGTPPNDPSKDADPPDMQTYQPRHSTAASGEWNEF
ncbi:MAG: methyl-accepting chemotaxis protein [Gammaproteobacteria bacterium]